MVSPPPRVLIGCAGMPPGLHRNRYFNKLDFIETSETQRGLPKPAVLKKWRRDSAAWFGLVAPVADPRTTDASQLAALAEATRLLDAPSVLFRTPPDLTPSSENRAHIQRFFTEVASQELFGSAQRIWEPQGLWETEEATELCSTLATICACDPITNDPLAPGSEFFASLPGNKAYFRISGLGRPQSALDEYGLEALLEVAQGYERCWLVFDTVAKFKDATNCRKLAQTLVESDA
jgi:uncharacterized protein YecE (DUF72 family)